MLIVVSVSPREKNGGSIGFKLSIVAKNIELEDVAEKSELLAIISVVGIISVPMYLIFKILHEIITIKTKVQLKLKDKAK